MQVTEQEQRLSTKRRYVVGDQGRGPFLNLVTVVDGWPHSEPRADFKHFFEADLAADLLNQRLEQNGALATEDEVGGAMAVGW